MNETPPKNPCGVHARTAPKRTALTQLYNVIMRQRSEHEQKQIEVIDKLERQAAEGAVTSSTVSPVSDYEADSRLCLTSVHFPHRELIEQIENTIIVPLKKITPYHFYYSNESLHMTIKNVRVIADPPNFAERDVQTAKQVFSGVIATHKKFQVYFYRLLLFPYNLALMGTTEPELDAIISDLDKRLAEARLPDDKKYSNNRYFFSNMTLARFTHPVSEKFKKEVFQLSQHLSFDPYTVDSVSLVTANAAMCRKRIVGEWKLG